MKFGVVVFPGSNCDADCYDVIDSVLQEPVEYVWHQEREIKGFDALILPGGFSYGDYLRTGAIARFSPVMPAVIDFARQGRLIIGILQRLPNLIGSRFCFPGPCCAQEPTLSASHLA